MRIYFFSVLMAACLYSPLAAGDEISLLSYFKGNGETGIYLACSEEGLVWRDLNEGRPIFVPPSWAGQNLTRDPSIVYHDGLFHLVWTSSWTGECFGATTSPDLQQWSPPVQVWPFRNWPADDRWVLVCKDEQMAELGGKNIRVAVAPARLEAVPPSERGRDAGDATAPRPDLVNALPPRFCDPQAWPGRADAEGNEARLAGRSRDKPAPSEAAGGAARRPWSGPVAGPGSSVQANQWVEGPTLLKVGDEWRLYFDRFRLRTHRFGLAVSKDLVHWTDRTDELTVPPQAMHGTIFRAPRAVILKGFPWP